MFKKVLLSGVLLTSFLTVTVQAMDELDHGGPIKVKTLAIPLTIVAKAFKDQECLGTFKNYYIDIRDRLPEVEGYHSIISSANKDKVYAAHQSSRNKFLYLVQEGNSVNLEVTFIPYVLSDLRPEEHTEMPRSAIMHPGEADRLYIPGSRILEGLEQQKQFHGAPIAFRKHFMNIIDLLPEENGKCSNIEAVANSDDNTSRDVIYRAVQSQDSKFSYFIKGDSVYLNLRFEPEPLEMLEEAVVGEDNTNVNMDDLVTSIWSHVESISH